MHATVYSGSIVGVDGLTVEVEVDLSRGIPSFSIVGLPNTAVRESRERVTAAIKNSGHNFPLERITVNLAPADIKKEGAAFDLAIAVGIMMAKQRRESSVEGERASVPKTVLLGELALNGSIRRVKGVLAILLHARTRGFERAIIPTENFPEGEIVKGLEVFGCGSLSDAWALLGTLEAGSRSSRATAATRGILHKDGNHVATINASANEDDDSGFGDVVGQESAKRALLVASAGGHHVLMVGPPGAGKTMLARRFPSILPPLSETASLETTMIYSTVGLLGGRGLIRQSPFRAPHHSASDAGLIGGGNVPRPGEVTLAHNGVLFLDELPEFKRHVLETLREPLEEGHITISRAAHATTFPASFQLVAAMNPCQCGNLGSPGQLCKCTPLQVERYLGKISGPLLDRISIHIFVRPVDVAAFKKHTASGCSMREQVLRAREIQYRRVGTANPSFLNARLSSMNVRQFCRLGSKAEGLLQQAQKRLRISARGRGHILRVARTIADLEGQSDIATRHVAEAIQYRVRDLPM